MVLKSRIREPRLTQQSHKVLSAFLNDPTGEFAGADLLDSTRLMSGTLYPILIRLEEAGWLRSRWERVDPSRAGRPRRRLYRITPGGLARVSALRAEILIGLPA
jgi:PadR family transcriptional regulator PadR